MPTAPTPVDEAPTVPDSSLAEEDFDLLYEDFYEWEKTKLQPGMNALGTNVYNNALEVQANVLAATAQVVLATAQAVAAHNEATAAGSAALVLGVLVWVSGATYTIDQVRYSPIDNLSYRRRTNGAGSVDPSLDPDNWAPTVAPAIPRAQVFSTAGTYTWTCPAWTTRAKFKVTGAGAGSPTNASRTPIAAAGGGTTIAWRAVVPGTVYTIIVGAGGAAGTGANGNGNAGGASFVTATGFTTLTAIGGGISLYSENFSSGGGASGGDINLTGGSTSNAASGGVAIPGLGGGSYWSPAGRYGYPGASPGVGGGGVAAGDTAGCAGAAGIVLIEY